MTPKRIAPLAAAALLAAACGGSSNDPADAGHLAGGTVGGLAPGAAVTLHLTAAGSAPQGVTVEANGAFQFPARLNSGVDWSVTVTAQPQVPRQTCQVAPDHGTVAAVAGAEVTVAVTCTTDTFPVGGTVEGLALDASVTLRAADGEVLVVTASAGSPAAIPFTFTARVPSGQPYAVTVLHQPTSPSQTCQVASGTGTVTTLPVSNVTVTCERNTKPVKVQVSGFGGGTPLVVQVNDAFDTEATSDALLDVLTNLASGVGYTVTVLTQPTNPWQTCRVVAGAAGTMGAVEGSLTAQVACTTDAFQVGGTVSGQLLPGLVLTNGGGDDLTVDGDGSFVFPTAVPSGQAYLVAVKTQPPTQVCVVTSETGTIGGAAVADVAVTCLCAAGVGNCDGSPVNGCETSTQSDVSHCGACGQVCTVANGTPMCLAGQCRVDFCTGAFRDCNAQAADGCEVDTLTDPRHCGGCGVVCSFPNAVAACAGGACRLEPGACLPGFASCDSNDANGCETDLASDPLHCGSCATVCSFPNAAARCVAQACQPGACDPGFGNCDNDPSNGCEANLSNDALHCGSCINACSLENATAACLAPFTCGIDACQGTFRDCNDTPSDGCEIDTATDGLHCGDCATACTLPHAQPSCGGGLCNTAQCDTGFKDCDGSVANGCERDVTSDRAHCGGCNNPCATDRVCSAGTCQLARSCRELLLQVPGLPSDVYTLDPDGAGPGGPVQAYCEMTFAGGGWTFFAHLNDDYQAADFFVADAGTYLPDRADGNATYGLGGTVYQHLGATELMVSIINADPALALGQSLVFYRFGAGPNGFTQGPIPSDVPGAALEYGLLPGDYQPGFFSNGSSDEWFTFTAGGEPLIWLLGGIPFGTGLGSGIDPTLPPNTVDSAPRDSWWYAR